MTEEMHRLVTELDSHLAGTVHPAVQAAFAHHALVAIHPFVDGNGRVARLLGSVFLLRDASIPLMIWADQSAEYRAALKEADAGRPQAFVDFVFDRAIDTMNLMTDRLRTRAAEGRMALRQEQERNQVAAAERLLEMVGRAVQRVVERGRDGFALTAETVEVIYVGRPMDLVHGSAQQLVATRGGAKAGCDFVIVICRDEVVSVAVDASAFRERRTFRVAELVPELRSSAAQQIEDFVVRACTEFLADLAS